MGPIEACACVDCHYLKDVQKNLLNLLRSAMPTTATRGKYRKIKITNLKPDLFKKHITPCINLCHSFFGWICVYSVFYRLHNQWLHRPFGIPHHLGGLRFRWWPWWLAVASAGRLECTSWPVLGWRTYIYIYIFVVWWGNWMKESLQKSHLRSLLPKLYCRGISNCIMYVRMYVCFWLFKYTYTWYMSIFLLFTIAFAIIIITRAWFVAILLSSQWSFQSDSVGLMSAPMFQAQPWSFGTPTLGFTYVELVESIQPLLLNNRLGWTLEAVVHARQGYISFFFVQDSEVTTTPTNL